MRIVLLAAGAVVGLALIAAVSVPVYQCRLHPMARLHQQLETGDEFVAVQAKFAKYMERSASDQAQFNDSVVSPRGSGPLLGLALYDWSIMDDLQLEVRFDSSGRLNAKSFICD